MEKKVEKNLDTAILKAFYEDVCYIAIIKICVNIFGF